MIFQDACLVLKSVKYECDKNGRNLQFLDEFDFLWSTNLHLKLLTLFADIRETYGYIFGEDDLLS